jgi:hypothetical protein
MDVVCVVSTNETIYQYESASNIERYCDVCFEKRKQSDSKYGNPAEYLTVIPSVPDYLRHYMTNFCLPTLKKCNGPVRIIFNFCDICNDRIQCDGWNWIANRSIERNKSMVPVNWDSSKVKNFY